MAVLMISPEIQTAIKAAVEKARENPLPLKDVLKLQATIDQSSTVVTNEKREKAVALLKDEIFSRRNVFVEIPVGFLAAISFEQQPDGLTRHLSVSVEREGKLPSPQAVKMIAEEFGFQFNRMLPGRLWIEEFEPGKRAVNLVELVREGPLH